MFSGSMDWRETGEMEFEWIYRLLESPRLYLLARILLTLTFWLSGITKLFDFGGAMAETAAPGLPAPALFAVLTILVQLIGSALVIYGGNLVWLGAGALGVFTAATIVLAHPFWATEGAAAKLNLTIAAEHVSVIGGLVVASILARRQHIQQ